jgi:hypothetical protein
MQLSAPFRVRGQHRAPESIWVSRYRSRIVEARLIIAYSLIAVMAALVIFGGILLSKRQGKARRRDAGKGDY